VPLVTKEALKLAFGNSFTADDLVQEGIIAAIAALETYDPGRGSVDGYVRACARNRMISYLRRNGHESPMEDEALYYRIDTAARTDSAPAGQQEAIEKREALRALLDKLSPFEASVLDSYLKEGGVSRAAEMMKCGRKKVDNALQRIRNKARGC
jgi:RNA polymerase sporulation-specific sigma factor